MSTDPIAKAERLDAAAKAMAASISDVSEKTFDFVVVGAGPAGLSLASRLAENPNITVAVIEAGGEMHMHDSITMPAKWGREHGNPVLAWPHETVIQPKLGRNFPWARGRGIGGSSGINFMVFQKPPAFDIDAWDELGAKGWNWDRYDKVLRRVENFNAPPEEDIEKFGYTFNAASHGKGGPIQTGYAKVATAGEPLLKQAFNNAGIPSTPDVAGGDIRGFGTFPNSIDPRTNTRSFAAIGYWLEKPRPNLHVLTGATVTKVLFKEGFGDAVAHGVQFTHEGEVHGVYAKHDVVLSAGCLRSSSLLELSGIGNKDILEPLGIQVRVNNPAVGENLQEHFNAGITWELKKDVPGVETLDLMTEPGFAEKHIKLYAQGQGLFLTHISSIAWLPLSDFASSDRFKQLVAAEEAQIQQDLADPKKARPGLKEQYDLMLKRVKSTKEVDAEMAYVPAFFPSPSAKPEPGKMYGSLIGAVNHPFSRGSIHIKSADPEIPASMDPNMFDHDFDMDILVEMYKFIRKVGETAPFKDIIAVEANPGPEVVTDDQFREAVKATVGSTWHTAGTCAMLPRDKGGVVDASLKVYGTKNLRVCDLSIIPLHVGSHTQTVAYAIGEQLADILKEELAA